jgi:microcystin-dependent protein
MEVFLGMIAIFPYNFVPKGWAECNGQLVPIHSNQALFALIGTTYGGDGKTNFALPNLQDGIPIGKGQRTSVGQVTPISSSSHGRQNKDLKRLNIIYAIATEGLWPSRDI